VKVLTSGSFFIGGQSCVQDLIWNIKLKYLKDSIKHLNNKTIAFAWGGSSAETFSRDVSRELLFSFLYSNYRIIEILKGILIF
jgi:hypothetical protein